jgi:hypothetical protein
MSAFPPLSYDIHSVGYGPVCMTCIQYMAQISGIAILFLISWICSFYLILNIFPVWPVYFNGQSRHLIWYMTLFSYLSVLVWCLNIFLTVFCVLKAILSCMSLKILVIRLISLAQHVKVAHFDFVVLGLCVRFVFVIVIVLSQVGLCCIHCFVVCLL